MCAVFFDMWSTLPLTHVIFMADRKGKARKKAIDKERKTRTHLQGILKVLAREYEDRSQTRRKDV